MDENATESSEAPLEGEIEVIDATRHHVLGVRSDYYGIWDKRATGEPLRRFPLTDEGFEQAEARFDELKRGGRSRITSSILMGVMVTALLGWVVGGAITAIEYGVFGFAYPEKGFSDLYEVAAVVNDISFRIWIACATVLAAKSLLLRIRER